MEELSLSQRPAQTNAYGVTGWGVIASWAGDSQVALQNWRIRKAQDIPPKRKAPKKALEGFQREKMVSAITIQPLPAVIPSFQDLL